ncbi:hypothetical protein LCGC14_2714400, partial [marine sediment metagenome]
MGLVRPKKALLESRLESEHRARR